MCSIGAPGSMYTIWCLLRKDQDNALSCTLVQGSFLFYTGKCIMIGGFGDQKGPLSAFSAGEAPYLNLHFCSW